MSSVKACICLCLAVHLSACGCACVVSAGTAILWGYTEVLWESLWWDGCCLAFGAHDCVLVFPYKTASFSGKTNAWVLGALGHSPACGQWALWLSRLLICSVPQFPLPSFFFFLFFPSTNKDCGHGPPPTAGEMQPIWDGALALGSCRVLQRCCVLAGWLLVALWEFLPHACTEQGEVERKELLNAKRICNKSHWFYKLQLVFNLFPFLILGALQQNPILNTFSSPSPTSPPPTPQKSVNILFGFLTSLHNSCLTSWLMRVT